MTFINKYNKPDVENYFYSEQFNEYNESFIYAIGQTEGNGLITKTDTSGNIVWERTYRSLMDQIRFFRKMIDTNQKEKLYVVHGVVKDDHLLIGLNAKGEIVWSYRLPWEDSNTVLDLVTSADSKSFFVLITEKNEAQYSLNPILLKFDFNGNLSNSIEIQHGNPIVFNVVKSHDKGIILIGKVLTEKKEGIIVYLSNDLRSEASFITDSFESDLYDFSINEYDRLTIVGYSYETTSVIVFNFDRNNLETAFKIINKTNDEKATIEKAAGNYFIVNYSPENGNVHKFNDLLDIQWSKTLVFNESGNGLERVKQRNNRFTFNCDNLPLGSSLLGNSDLSLNTCKTHTLTTYEVFQKNFKFKESKVSVNSFSVEAGKDTISYEKISSSKTQICTKPDLGGVVFLSDNTSLQSPDFILNAAGSTGEDGSAKGIHLRWFMGGVLGDLHLPKGNYYLNENFIFNKPDDFVRIYRAPYTPIVTTIDFSVSPNIVNPVQRFWIYKIGGKQIYVYFKDFQKYDTLLNEFDPMTQSFDFVKSYSGSLIEIESKKDLFFCVRFKIENATGSSLLHAETLSVEKNVPITPKITSSRGTYDESSFPDLRIFNENCRSIRYTTSDCYIIKLYLEFYSDFLTTNNQLQAWEPVGEYALTLNDTKALYELEPVNGSVNATWPRYNDGECVDIKNYIHKWNGTLEENDRNIKNVVETFLQLSTDISNPNPTGIEVINLDLNLENEDGSTPEPSEDDYTSLPLLDILNMGAIDYHIARLLGLGTLDLSYYATTGNQYVYLSEYITYGDLEDGLGEREVQHLSMSLPTSYKDERLPLPVELSQIVPGIISQDDEEEPVMMTDENGYTPDGKYRFVTLESAELPEEQVNRSYFWQSTLFNQSEYSYPVIAGLEYKMDNQQDWVKPELSNDVNYQNIFQGDVGSNETVSLMLPEDNNVLYIHKQSESGDHHYLTYGVNIFSRATIGVNQLTITTLIKPENLLQPPHNINAFLIREESPLMLTSQEDQDRRSAIQSSDKTLVRLTFEYNTFEELSNYQIEEVHQEVADADIESLELNSEPNYIYPDDKEVFADEIEIYFRNEQPNIISGRVTNITDDPLNEMVSILSTGDFILSSTAEHLYPIIPAGKQYNFIGGKLLLGDNAYFVHEIDNSGTYPIIKILKNTELDQIEILEDGYFQLVENMQLVDSTQNPSSWDSPFNSSSSLSNPLLFKVQIGIPNSSDWQLKREVINLVDEFGNQIRFLEKTRGFWKEAIVEEFMEAVQAVEQPDGSIQYQEAFNGIYKVTFVDFILNQHPQFSQNNNSVEWFRGILRLRTESSFLINGERKALEVVRMENIGSDDLVLYIFDNNYPGYDATQEELDNYDTIQLGNQFVNYYPGYKVYLYENQSVNLTEEGILPAYGDGNKYSIFGLRSHDLTVGFTDYFSKVSVPVLMFAQEIIEPQKPQTPLGAKYATRPDFYGKSTYTFSTSFGSNSSYQPYSLQFLRSNDDIILNSLYETSTVKQIRESLKVFGGNDEVWLKNRWDNFFDFDNYRNTTSDGLYVEFPDNEEVTYRFPMPDSESFINGINEFITWHNQNNGTNTDASLVTEITALNQIVIATTNGVENNVFVVDFIEQVVKNTFVPLTEIPIIFQYIKPNIYKPVYKKQNVRDADGYMLSPNDPDFDIAPMAKRVASNTNEVQFTDFTLDGTSKNVYFYSAREIGSQMKLGEMSDILGPIKLVNTNAPETPEIKRMMPVLESRILGIAPGVSFEINRYAEEQFIKKINLYRTFSRLEAQSIRTMELVKVVDLESENIENNDIWSIVDNFEDMEEVPFGEPLFYRITVSRKVEYSENGTDSIIEYAPSNPSKLVATTIVENYIPDSPALNCYSDAEENDYVNFVTLHFQKTCYNGIYHLYKMNSQGNWVKIHQVQSNDVDIYIHLEQTDLQNPNLRILSEEGDRIYHHFKVITENTAGMMSTQEKILTIFNEVTWSEIGGIGEMIVDGTFRVR